MKKKCLYDGKIFHTKKNNQKFCCIECKTKYNMNNSPQDVYYYHLRNLVYRIEDPDIPSKIAPISKTSKPARWARRKSLGAEYGANKFENKLRKHAKDLNWKMIKEYRCKKCNKQFWSSKRSRICPKCHK